MSMNHMTKHKDIDLILVRIPVELNRTVKHHCPATLDCP